MSRRVLQTGHFRSCHLAAVTETTTPVSRRVLLAGREGTRDAYLRAGGRRRRRSGRPAWGGPIGRRRRVRRRTWRRWVGRPAGCRGRRRCWSRGRRRRAPAAPWCTWPPPPSPPPSSSTTRPKRPAAAPASRTPTPSLRTPPAAASPRAPAAEAAPAALRSTCAQKKASLWRFWKGLIGLREAMTSCGTNKRGPRLKSVQISKRGLLQGSGVQVLISHWLSRGNDVTDNQWEHRTLTRRSPVRPN